MYFFSSDESVFQCFGPPQWSIACCPLAAVSHLKAAFVPSPWLRSYHTKFSTTCFTQCHTLRGWPDRFVISRPRRSKSPRQCSVSAAAFLDLLFQMRPSACSSIPKHFHNSSMWLLRDAHVGPLLPGSISAGWTKRSQDNFSQVHGSSSPTVELVGQVKGHLAPLQHGDIVLLNRKKHLSYWIKVY